MSQVVESTAFIHPSGICESRQVGEGTRLWAFAHVLDGAVVGRDCNLGDHVFIEGGARLGDRVTVKNGVMIWNGVTIEDDVFIGPGVVFTNDRYPRSPRMPAVAARYRHPENWLVPTRVCQGASIGAAAVILGGVTIGHYATIGAGSVVTRHVADHQLVVGHPARPVGWVCVCGVRLDEALACPACGRCYELKGEALAGVGQS